MLPDAAMPLTNAASWEKGLTYVAEGTITQEEYMVKLENFIRLRTENVLAHNFRQELKGMFDASAVYYKKKVNTGSSKSGGRTEK